MRDGHRIGRRGVAIVAGLTLLGALVVSTSPASATTASVANEAQYRAALTALSSDNTGPHTITLTADITLSGGTDPTYTGAQNLTVDGDGHTIDAGGTSRILSIPTLLGTGHHITVLDATLTGGNATGDGGAVYATNALVRVEGSTLHHNTAAGVGGAVGSPFGVAVAVNATFTANTADKGGALYGGGIQLAYATLVGNSASFGANVYSTGTLNPFGSVLADPQGGGGNCAQPTTVPTGHNWSTDASCNLTGPGDTQNGADPQLGALADNGGPTPTLFPAATSPLVDAIPTASCAPSTPDQRGVARPQPAGGNCDIGAVEIEPPRPDGRIKRGSTGTQVGDDIYNTTGTDQTRRGSAARGGTVTYFVSVQNDAPFPDALRLKGTASNSRFKVKYSTSGSGITNGVTGGTYTTPVLAPGATFTVKVVVTVLDAAPVGSSLSATLIAKSNADLTVKDTVKFVTSRS